MAREKKHRTGHYINPDKEGHVICYCEACKWRSSVSVAGLSFVDAMTAIYAARDAHEANPSATSVGLDGEG